MHFTADNFVVTSGRLDLQGYMAGSIEVDAKTVFSPGNSIGEATFDGNFTLKDGATLLMEIGTNDSGDVVSDQLIVNGNIDLGDNSIILLAFDENSSLAPNTSFTVDLISGSGVTEDTLDAVQDRISSYYFTIHDITRNGNLIQLSATLDANAVPEPSTWALLALGVVALFLRKRVRS